MNEKLKQKFKDIRGLKTGWDGYKAPPIRKDLIDKLEAVLNKMDFTIDPDIVPTLEGGIALDWIYGDQVVSIYQFPDMCGISIHHDEYDEYDENIIELPLTDYHLSFICDYLKSLSPKLNKLDIC